MLIAQKPGLIDLEPTGISSWLVVTNRIAHSRCESDRADGDGAALALVRFHRYVDGAAR